MSPVESDGLYSPAESPAKFVPLKTLYGPGDAAAKGAPPVACDAATRSSAAFFALSKAVGSRTSGDLSNGAGFWAGAAVCGFAGTCTAWKDHVDGMSLLLDPATAWSWDEKSDKATASPTTPVQTSPCTMLLTDIPCTRRAWYPTTGLSSA